MITFRPSAKLDKQALLVAFSQEQVGGKNFSSVPQALRKSITDIVGGKQFLGENGETFPLLVQKQLVLLVGVGETKNINLTTLRCTLRRALLSAPLKKAKEVELILHDQSSAVVVAAIEAVILGTYRWSKYQAPNPSFIENKKVFIVAQAKPAYQQAVTICEGTNLARDLINENADVVTSDYLEKTIRSIIKDKKNVKLEILNRKELKAKGLNLHLAVNQGSNKEPKLIIVQYTGLPVHKNYTALVGKGVTFDTGGLNIKPTGSMETMRTDMSGSAAVIGTLYNTVKLNLRKNVIFVCGIAENAIGSAAYKPGDVFVSYAGKSVEILNTDAEGRLVLADAIAYTVKNYKPSR
ncbi:MAG: M17 family peptidase N-terminal domain-containing protein, partial [Candidatus Omnitrophota bacterium]|nr:M17 family peptidase N-terminal domain-containing protein [Candidatus Omnitrophota bacterium]